MVRAPEGEEWEMKIDILKMVLYDNGIYPNVVNFETIRNAIAERERETVMRYVRDLAESTECPLEYYSEEKSAVCFTDRREAVLFIDEFEGTPWYMSDLE